MDNGGDLDLIDIWRIKNPELKKDDLYGDKRTPKYVADSIFFFSRKSMYILQLNQYTLVIRKKRKEKTGT